MRIKAQLLSHLSCDLDMEIVPGKMLVISGDNGIGKTTLLNFLSQEIPDSVLCEQKNSEHFFDRTLAVFRSILTKSENLNAELFGLYWNQSGLSKKEDRKVMSLSGGESQILKLIVHSTARGDVYLFDEPGQYLDRDKKQFARQVMMELVARGKSVVVVEHDHAWLPTGSVVLKLENQNGVLERKDSWTI